MSKPAKINIKGTIVSDEDKWIYDWFGISAVCPKDVISIIDKLNGEDLEVDINSGGGDVFAGSEIYTAIRNYKGNVIINCVGLAGSAASVILTAGKNKITPTGMVMIHNTSGSARGDYHDMDKSSEILQQANKAISNAYIEKTGMTQEALLELMDKETWMTAQEAIEYGFVDEIMENKNQNQSLKSPLLKNSGSIAIYNSSPVLDRKTIEKIRSTIKAPGNLENNVPVVTDKTDDNKEHFFNNSNKKGSNNMSTESITDEITNVEQLTAKYPTLVQQIINSATNEERNRIKEIDEIANTLTDEIVNEAKYVNPIKAETLALQALKTNSQIGNKTLENMVKDIENSGANNVQPQANTGFAEPENEVKAAKVKNLAAKLSRKK